MSVTTDKLAMRIAWLPDAELLQALRFWQLEPESNGVMAASSTTLPTVEEMVATLSGEATRRGLLDPRCPILPEIGYAERPVACDAERIQTGPDHEP